MDMQDRMRVENAQKATRYKQLNQVALKGQIIVNLQLTHITQGIIPYIIAQSAQIVNDSTMKNLGVSRNCRTLSYRMSKPDF